MGKQKEYMLVKHSHKTFYFSKNVYKLISFNKGWSNFIYAVLGEEGSQDLYHVELLRKGKPSITDRFEQKDVFLKLYPRYEVVYLD